MIDDPVTGSARDMRGLSFKQFQARIWQLNLGVPTQYRDLLAGMDVANRADGLIGLKIPDQNTRPAIHQHVIPIGRW